MFSKDLTQICNLSKLFDILGTSISQNVFKLPLLTVVRNYKILIFTQLYIQDKKLSAKKTEDS